MPPAGIGLPACVEGKVEEKAPTDPQVRIETKTVEEEVKTAG
jgi:hypothetical protein